MSEIRASYRDISDIFFNIFLLSNLDLTPNCDNTRDLHPSLRGNVNLEVTFNHLMRYDVYRRHGEKTPVCGRFLYVAAPICGMTSIDVIEIQLY